MMFVSIVESLHRKVLPPAYPPNPNITTHMELSTLPLEARWEHLQALAQHAQPAAWATLEPEERAATLAILHAEERGSPPNKISGQLADASQT